MTRPLRSAPLVAALCALTSVALCALAPSVARADDPKYEFKAPPNPEDKPTTVNASIQAGALWVSGNSESIGVSGAGQLSIRHYNNQLAFFGNFAYAYVGTSTVLNGPIDGHKIAAENWLAGARYDRYFLKDNTIFALFRASADYPGGINIRLEPQIGYARLFFHSIHQMFRGELGYDYAYEQYLLGTTPIDASYHSVRAYLFYENKFTTYASFSEGLEAIEALNKLQHFRLNSVTSLSSTIAKNIALKINFTAKFNNDPPARPAPATGTFGPLDTTLEAVLAVTFL